MYGVKSHVCSAFPTYMRQTFFPHWPWDCHFTLAINLVAKQQQFLNNCMGTLWLGEGSIEALVSILNYFVCPVSSLLLVDFLKFSRGTKLNTLRKQPRIPRSPQASTLLSSFSLLLCFLAETASISSQKLVQGQGQPWAFSLLLIPWVFDRRWGHGFTSKCWRGGAGQNGCKALSVPSSWTPKFSFYTISTDKWKDGK